MKRSTLLAFKCFLSLVLCATSYQAHANLCIDLFSENSMLSKELNDSNILKKGLIDEALKSGEVDPRELLINLESFYSTRQKSPEKYELDFVSLKSDKVDIDYTEPQFEYQGQKVTYYMHPTNEYDYVPFSNSPEKWKKGLTAYSSASRSVYLLSPEGNFYSLRMATDFPNGKEFKRNMNKAEGLDQEISLALSRTRYVKQVMSRLKTKLKSVVLALDVVAMAPKSDRRFNFGNMLRDLNFMNDGKHYYIPVFSIPFLYKKIAQKNNTDPKRFWEKHYIEALGVAQAELFVKFGILHQFPHGQNILMEFDRDFKPTGRFVFRDLDDTQIFSGVANSIRRQFPSELNSSETYAERLDIETSLIMKVFSDYTETLKLSSDTIKNWYNVHRLAFIQKVANEINSPDYVKFPVWDMNTWINGSASYNLNNYFNNQFVE